MCDENETITLNVDEESGSINIKIDPWGIWDAFSAVDKEEIMRDGAYWHIIEQSLKSEMGKGVSSPHFKSSVHYLREMILTDNELVSNMIVTFTVKLLELLADAVQEKRAADNAFWKLYHKVECHECRRNSTPLNVREEIEPEYFRIANSEVKEDILWTFKQLLAETEEKP